MRSHTLLTSIAAAASVVLFSASLVRAGDYADTVTALDPIGYWKLDELGFSASEIGVFGQDSVLISDDARVDSWSSSTGPYDPGEADANATVATNDDDEGAISILDNAYVGGDVYIGNGGEGDEDIVVGDDATVTGDTGDLDEDLDLPPGTEHTNLPASSGNVSYSGGTSTIDDDMLVGRMSITGGTVVISGHVRIVCTEWFSMNAGEIRIGDDSSLTLIVDEAVNFSGSATVNAHGHDPTRLLVLTNTSSDELHVTGSAQVYGRLFGPSSTIRVNGDAHVLGTIAAADVVIEEDGQVHVDEDCIPGSERTAVDSANGNDGTMFDGVLGAAGAVDGTAAWFDGDDDYILVAHDDRYLVDEGAIAFWFTSDDTSGKMGLFSKDSTNFDNGGHIHCYAQSRRVKVRLQSTSKSYELQSDKYDEDDWHHVAVTWGEDGFFLYVNGTLEDSDSYTGGLGSSSGGSGNAEPIVFGGNTWQSGDEVHTPVKDFFEGAMDEIAIFDEQLDAATIAILADGGDCLPFDETNVAIAVAGDITVRNGATIDAWNSEDGAYDEDLARDIAVIATNATSAGSIDLDDDVRVGGSAYVGAGGDGDSGVSVSDGGILTGLRCAIDAALPIPEMICEPQDVVWDRGDMHYNAGSARVDYNMVCDNLSFSRDIYISIRGDVRIIVENDFWITDDVVMDLQDNSSLTIYVKGDRCEISGNVQVNTEKADASLVTIYHLAESTMTVEGDVDVYARLVSVESSCTISDGAEFHGAVIAESIVIDDAAFHHDLSLAPFENLVTNCGMVYYVRTSGSDSSSGLTPATAFATIQKAVNSCTDPGDMVFVGPGTYYEQVWIGYSTGSPAGHGEADLPIRIIGDVDGSSTGDAAGDVIIDGENSRSYGIYLRQRNHWEFSNLTFQNQRSYNIYAYWLEGITVDDCTFHVPRAYAIYPYRIHDLTVTDNVFHRTRSSRHIMYAIYASGTVDILRNRSTLTGDDYRATGWSGGWGSGYSSGWGGYCYGLLVYGRDLDGHGEGIDLRMENNVLSDLYLPLYCYLWRESGSAVIAHNTISEALYGIYCYPYSYGASMDVTISDNIVCHSYYSMYVYGYYASSLTIDGLVSYDITYGNDYYVYGGTVQNHIRDEDPLWVDPASGNFDLQEGSPALDAGTNLAGLTSDIRLAVRPYDGDGDGNAVVDLGAYEKNDGEAEFTPPRVICWQEKRRDDDDE